MKGREVQTALRVGRSPVGWVLAIGGTPSALLTSENFLRYVEALNDARTLLADCFSVLQVEQDGIEGGSVHMQAIGVLNEAELLEPIHKKTHS